MISVCPPAAAEELAQEVLAHGFTGLYVDANAISPQRAERIAAAVRRGGARFVDGSIIGPPAWKPGTTWLYLSGPDAEEALRSSPPAGAGHRFSARRLAGPSALKMVYAAYTRAAQPCLPRP